MKKLKLSKKVQMIMITLLVITMGIIFVGILSNNNVNASGSKPVCPICTTSTNMQYTGATEAGHTYVCSQHGQSKTESHAFSGGSCTLCGYKETHTHNWEVLGRNSADANQHNVVWKCSGCSQTKTTKESHTFNSENKCTLCGYSKQTTCAHSSTMVVYTYTTTQHSMVNKCNSCGATVSVIKTEPHSHDSSGNCVCGHFRNEYDESDICTCPSDKKTTTKSDDEYHEINCTGCGNFYFVKHNYQVVPATTTTSGHTTKCTGCGDVKTAEACTFETEHDTQKHYVRCTICGGRWGSLHNFGTPTSNDGTTHTLKCTIGAPYNCGYTKVESHTWGTPGAWTSNGNKTHSRQVTCSDGCGGTKTETADCAAAAGTSTCSTCGANLGTGGGGGGTPSGGGGTGDDTTQECEHTYEYKNDNNNHWEECKKCNDKKASEAHKYGNFKDNGDGTHSRTCEVCKYELKANHNYTNGKCSDCQAVEPCSHEYEMKKDANNHWEECKKCQDKKTSEAHKFGITADNGDGTHGSKCTVCEYAVKENHAFGNCTDNGDGTHSKECGTCKLIVKENHNYENGTCKECGVAEPKPVCTHEYELESDGTQHWEKCKKCDEVKDGSQESHIYTSYTNNNDDTHSSKCIKCEYEMTEPHSYTNGTCSKCSAVENNNDDNNNDDNNNDDNNNDDNNNDDNNNDDNNNDDNNNDDNNNDNNNNDDNNNDDNNNDNNNNDNNNNDDNNNDDNNNDDNNNNNNNNNDGNNNNNSNGNNTSGGNTSNSSSANKNDTTAKNEIPKAGLKSSALLLIAVLAITLLVARQKMKKYKDI